MKNSLINMKERLKDDQLARCIEIYFMELGRSRPIITSRNYGNSSKALYAQGQREDEWCWINVIEWPPGQRIANDCPYACSIESRGDELFSAIVVSAISLVTGGIIYDDAGYLWSGHEFSPDEFREKLLVEVSQKYS
ncbi:MULTISPECIES: hypothetical protein [Burkholderia]|uniref:hypothetical protein n=1 Tax=Burkholderia TaxID=32008 RepID=UPI00124848BA|nr:MULTISPECIES: hypothetical protein [Burkholderia]KAB0662170.1 hypothetical protein F7R23_03595 [Burkholderia diffusa]MBM2652259.1 hypothetical protein [Burkholderia diffusa]